jgi:murein DD-endopeptidase MepM/ murein hydrolase activator NlpD
VATVIASLTALAIAFPVAAPTSATWPVASSRSYVSQWYSSYHKALDIAAPRGASVLPVSSGRVVFAGWKQNCGGYQVWVAHGSGRYSTYYHLGRRTVSRGQTVTAQRTRLGTVGSSGCASGPHVHVERWIGYPWRSGSRRVSPWSWIDDGIYLPTRYR